MAHNEEVHMHVQARVKERWVKQKLRVEECFGQPQMPSTRPYWL